MTVVLEWSGEGCAYPDWDCCEAIIELPDRIMTVCPFVAALPGPDERSIFTIDVPDGHSNIRSIAVGFASSIEDAKAAVTKVIDRIRSGLNIA